MNERKTIGIIGGGQLGLMIAEAARPMGIRTVCLDPAPDAPAGAVCDEHIVGRFDDAAAVEELCRRSDAVTYEFENVPGEILIPLCGKYNIPQGYKPLYDSQDRLREKTNAREHGLTTPRFAAVDDERSLRDAVDGIGLPAVLKTRTLGYDGHGQLVLRTEADLERALPLLSVPCILEEFVPFDFEASIVMVADRERVVSFPVGRNVHRDGILAPRPHNSGHYTIEGATTSQFRELVRYLAGMPLEEPRLVAPTVMKNILGQDLETAERIAAEGHEGVHVHLYGKTESRPKRKIGHITFVGMTAGEYERRWAARFV